MVSSSSNMIRVNRAWNGLRTWSRVFFGAILRSLFRHNVSDLPADVDLGLYCVVALAADREDYGVVVGNVRAPHRLVVLNHSDIHFNPCLHLD